MLSVMQAVLVGRNGARLNRRSGLEPAPVIPPLRTSSQGHGKVSSARRRWDRPPGRTPSAGVSGRGGAKRRRLDLLYGCIRQSGTSAYLLSFAFDLRAQWAAVPRTAPLSWPGAPNRVICS